jgi:hypothetical protein
MKRTFLTLLTTVALSVAGDHDVLGSVHFSFPARKRIAKSFKKSLKITI